MVETQFKTIKPEIFLQNRNQSQLYYKKTAQVTARKAVPGEVIYTITSDNHEETKNIAKANQMVVQNPDGEEYIIDIDKFKSRYTRATDEISNGYILYDPISYPVRPYFLNKDENVQFIAPWGSIMKIRGGGVLIDNGPDDIYGIQPDEFRSTYSPCDAEGNLL